MKSILNKFQKILNKTLGGPMAYVKLVATGLLEQREQLERAIAERNQEAKDTGEDLVYYLEPTMELDITPIDGQITIH